VSHVQAALSDHEAVVLTIQPPGMPAAGPGLWRFPVHLLRHPQYSAEVEAVISDCCQQAQAEGGNYQQHWQMLKASVREVAVRLDRAESQRRRGDQLFAMQAAQAASRQYAAHPASPIAQQQRELASRKLRKQLLEGAGRQHTAAAALWRERGEKGSRWFHSLTCNQRSQQPITQLADGQGTLHSFMDAVCPSLLDAVAVPFYSSSSPSGLFHPSATDAGAQDLLLGSVDRTLNAQQAAAAEGPAEDGTLTVACLAAALANSANGKAPGPDGLPVEFYRKYWELLGPLLVSAANEVFASGVHSMPELWARGVILPIHKGKGLPKHLLSSYRPITLLNADYKLISKAVADRMQQPLDFIIDPCQTAFIKGRWIGDNVLFHLGLAEHLAAVHAPGAVVILDIEKAYDRTNRPWLYRVSEKCGFAGGTRRWIRLLTSGTTSRVAINGWLSSSFPVTSGLPQGSPLSPLLWNLQLQPLTSRLQQLQRLGLLRTPVLPNGMPASPVFHHADDTKLLVLDADQDGPVAMSAVQAFCAASAARVHGSKSKGVTLGSHASIFGVHAPTGADFGAEGGPAPQILGIPLSADVMGTASEAVFKKRLHALHFTAASWSVHPLSLVGRGLVAKQVMASSVTYHATFVPPNCAQLSAMQQVLLRYLAGSPLPEDAALPSVGGPALQPKPAVGALPRQEGGLALVDVASHISAMHGKIVAAMLSPGKQAWKVLMQHALAAAAPSPKWGAGWVATALPLAACPSLSPRLAAYVASYRATQPHAIMPTATDAPCCLGSQPLYFNSNISPDAALPVPHFLPPQPLPVAWPMTLAQLAAAPPATQEHPSLQPIIQAALARWPDHLTAIRDCLPAQPSRWLVDSQRLRVADTLQQPPTVYTVCSSGRLHTAPPSLVLNWEPACVLKCPKPRHCWSIEELQHYNQQLPQDKASARPLENQYLGPWMSSQHGPGIALYPAAWGHAGQPLHQYAVKTARDMLVLKLGQEAIPGYRLKHGMEPRLWRLQAPPQQRQQPLQQQQQQQQQQWQDQQSQAGAGRPTVQPASAGISSGAPSQPPSSPWLQRLTPWERGWAQQIVYNSSFHPDPHIFQASWMLPSQPRAHPRERAAARVSALNPMNQGPGMVPLPVQGPLHGHPADVQPHHALPNRMPAVGASHDGLHASARVDIAVASATADVHHATVPLPPNILRTSEAHRTWRRLWSCPADNSCKVLGWRLLHAALPVRCMKVAQRGGTPAMAHCQFPACALPRAGRKPFETYTHIFLDCPAARPVVEWLRRLWAAIAGTMPPDDSLVLLGDHAPSWPEYPRTKARQHLWTFLRLTVLYEIWRAHQVPQLPAEQGTPRAVVARCISVVADTLHHLFYRSAHRQHLIEHLPLHLLSEEVLECTLESFQKIWCDGDGLCSIVGPAGDGKPRLFVRLSVLHPVVVGDLDGM
jgi:hypothetical protein